MRTLLVLFSLLASTSAQAFCGFYVSGADQSLYANATMVVLMRDGTRTVLSMQNNYQGPPQDFAMVVPVPQVLKEDNVKTLSRDVFQRVDSLAAPRLVEYWEQDPCAPQVEYTRMSLSSRRGVMKSAPPPGRPDSLGVTIEAQFDVAEYQVVILSARDSGGLDAWLRAEKYNIPEGAEPVLRPYVESGTKFFVAKVDPKKVTFTDGQAVLSPLRFHYDTDTFSLPVRLGLLNSNGEQDLIVHVLAKGQRYEAANYDNVFIPTNIRVLDGVRDSFGGFYEALFDKTAKHKRRTVVTEYSWQATSCDPCPTQPLQPAELATLGADVIKSGVDRDYGSGGFVLTRMHYRYGKDGLDEDLVFRAAPPVIGGRGMPDASGELPEKGASPAGTNNFQGRYVILHPWTAEVACKDPRRGEWGGPPGGGSPKAKAAQSRLSTGGPAAAPIALARVVDQDIPEIGVKRGAATDAPAPVDPGTSTEPTPADDGPPRIAPGGADEDRGCSVAPATATLGLALLTLPFLLRRRRTS